MKHFTNIDVDYVFNYLVDNCYFDLEGLLIIIKAFGDNIKTYNTICYAKYGLDFDQIYDQDIGEQ